MEEQTLIKILNSIKELEKQNIRYDFKNNAISDSLYSLEKKIENLKHEIKDAKELINKLIFIQDNKNNKSNG